MICRSCASPDLVPVLDLGLRYAVMFPETADGPITPAAPIRLARCRACTLVQLLDTIPREQVYRDYWSCSGTNEVMRAELRDVVESARARVDDHDQLGGRRPRRQ